MNPNISKKRRAKSRQAQGQHEHGGDEHGSNGHGGHQKINVGEIERQLSMIGGTVLAVCGLLRGSLSGLGLAAIGGALIWRGHTGHCEMYHMLGQSSAADSSEHGKRLERAENSDQYGREESHPTT